jgi:hypothetical protein
MVAVRSNLLVVWSNHDLVEVYRPDMPWGRPPLDGTSWTSDVGLRHILDSSPEQI